MKTFSRPSLAHGQALLLSVLFLLFVLTGIALIGSRSSVQQSQSLVSAEKAAIAKTASAGCIELALNRLALNHAYLGNETIQVTSSTSCQIRPVIVGGNTWTLESSSTVDVQTSLQRAVLSSLSPVTISSWLDLTSF